MSFQAVLSSREQSNLGGRGGKRKTPLRPAPRSDHPSSTKLKDVAVLVVDDDPLSAKLVSVVLKADGCNVQIARSAEQALAILRTFRPRVIVMDVVLPLMSGLLLAARLKADPKTSGIAIIAVTAFNGPEAARVALEAGCAAYVRKPIDPIAFTQLVIDNIGDPK